MLLISSRINLYGYLLVALIKLGNKSILFIFNIFERQCLIEFTKLSPVVILTMQIPTDFVCDIHMFSASYNFYSCL